MDAVELLALHQHLLALGLDDAFAGAVERVRGHCRLQHGQARAVALAAHQERVPMARRLPCSVSTTNGRGSPWAVSTRISPLCRRTARCVSLNSISMALRLFRRIRL